MTAEKDLAKVRIHEVSGRNTAGGGALLQETSIILNAVSRKGGDVSAVREAVLKGKILSELSFESRKRIWRAIRDRYLIAPKSDVMTRLIRANQIGSISIEFVSLAYLCYVLRDCLVYLFVTGPLCDQWRAKTTHIDRGDFLEFLDERSLEFAVITKWRESSRKKLATNVMSALRDFGILKGTKIKHIQRPTIAPGTVHCLLSILLAEGLKGKEVIDAPDWRLFLWSEADTTEALLNLSKLGLVRFERSTNTVIIELIDNLEDKG